MQEFPESRASLWRLIVGPTIWAGHFMLVYVTAAIWCAKVVGKYGPLGGVRSAVAVYTGLALAGIAWSLWRGYRDVNAGNGDRPYDEDSSLGRHRFLGFANLLLSGLSAVGVIYVALPAAFIGSCQ